MLPDTRYSLIARLAEPADAGAWSELSEIYEQAVFRYCRGRGLQEADALDVVQQVLLTVHQKIADWRPSGRPGAFRAWLIEIAHRSCLRAFREVARRRRDAGGSDFDGKLADLAAAGASLEKDQSIRDWQRWAFCWAAGLVEREVEPQTWQAFLLTAVQQTSAADAARRLNLRIGSVYTAKCRVLARIRELVSDLSKAER